MEKRKPVQGIYFKPLPGGSIFVGYHLPTLYQELLSLKSKSDWGNFEIEPLAQLHEKGYSHKALKNMEGLKDKSGEVLTSN